MKNILWNIIPCSILFCFFSNFVWADAITDPQKLYELGRKAVESKDYSKANEYMKLALKSGKNQNDIENLLCGSFYSELNHNIDNAIVILQNGFFKLNDCRNINKRTPFDTDIQKGNIIFVKLLLANGFDVNLRGSMDFTPLLSAVCQSQLKIAKFLIENGADIDSTSTSTAIVNGERSTSTTTPLKWAVGNGDIEMANFLLTSGANVNKLGALAASISERNLKKHNLEMATLLLANGADPNFVISNEKNLTFYCHWSSWKEENSQAREIYNLLKKFGGNDSLCQ